MNDLNGVEWNIHESMPINIAWESFVNKFTNVCDKHAPVKSIRFKNELCPWLGHRDDIFSAMHKETTSITRHSTVQKIITITGINIIC